MKPLENDYFADKAKDYDIQKDQTENIDNISLSLLRELDLSKEMKIIDFGSGTGLLLERVAPYAGSITAVTYRQQ